MKVDRVHKWKSNDPESVVDQQYSRETQDCHGVETVVCDDEHSPAHWTGTLLIIKTCRLFALIHHQQWHKLSRISYLVVFRFQNDRTVFAGIYSVLCQFCVLLSES